MATQHLDLDEQEQIANLKYFWGKYGRWISVIAFILIASYAAWSGWKAWKVHLEQKSAIRFDELSAAVVANDVTKVDAILHDMQREFGATSYTAQAALLDARSNYAKGNVDAAKAALQWLIDSRAEAAYRDVAKLRLGGLLIESKQYEQAIQLLSSDISPSFKALAADRIGDAYSLQGKTAEAKAQYETAYRELPITTDYRKMVEVKLIKLGAAPKEDAS